MESIFWSENSAKGIKKLVKKTNKGFFYFDTALKFWVSDNSLSLADDKVQISRDKAKSVLENYLGICITDSFLD